MSYKIDEIEGISPAFQAKLQAAEINTTSDLLTRCGDPKGRAAVATFTGIGEGQILRWANMADLMRVSGVGKQYAELLEGAGVDTIKELRHRNAANLTAAIKTLNEEKRLARNSPAEELVEKWIAQAKELEPTITH